MKLVKVIFNIVAIIFGIAILAILGGHFGIVDTVKPFIVQSGSMEPSIPVGSVVFVRAAPSYEQGDVITFRSQGNKKNIVTHRILYKEFENVASNEPVFLTIGDANKDVDTYKVKPADIIGKSYFSLPFLGYAINLAKQPKGFILFVIIPATIIVYEEFRSIQKEIAKIFRKKRSKEFFAPLADALPPAPIVMNNFDAVVVERTFPKAVLLIPLFGCLLVFVAFSKGFFFDNEQSNQNILAAADSFASPTPTTGSTPTPTPSISITPTPGSVQSGNVVINEINWGGSNGDGNDEWIELFNTTGNPVNLTNWVVENLGGGGPNANITIPSGTIPANGFFLIASQPKTSSKINVDPDTINSGISLGSGGEQLVLRTSSGGTIIDTANGTGAWFAGDNNTPKKSMERKSPPGSGTVAGNWQTATTHTNMDAAGATDEFGTPKATNGL